MGVVPDVPDPQAASSWVTFISGTAAIVGGAIGALITAVLGAWRARGLLAELEAKDGAAKVAIDALRKEIDAMKQVIEHQDAMIKANHAENATAIHRLANFIQKLPDMERFNRLEDRMMAILQQAISTSAPPRSIT